MCRLSEIFLQVSAKYGDVQKNYEGAARIFHLYFYIIEKGIKGRNFIIIVYRGGKIFIR